MNKEEWIWVAIRIFGIYLCVLAIINIPDALSNLYLLLILPDTNGDIIDSNGTIDFVNSMKQTAESNTISATLKAFMFAGVGLYFMCGGKVLHSIVVKQ